MKPSKEQIIGIIIILIALTLAVGGYILLPEQMIVQITLGGGTGNMLPKLPAILIPLAISTISSILYMQRESSRRVKNLILALIGILIAVFGFIVNYGK